MKALFPMCGNKAVFTDLVLFKWFVKESQLFGKNFKMQHKAMTINIMVAYLGEGSNSILIGE